MFGCESVTYFKLGFNCVQLVPIKTLQSLHAKFRVIFESFETNLDCTMITRHLSFFTVCFT